MKKITSLFLALLLLLSLFGCGQASAPAPEITQSAAELFTVPDLTGLHIDGLSPSEQYSVKISHEMENAGYMDGEIVSQAPVAGAEAEEGAVIYVIVHRGGDPWTDVTETEPAPTEPTRPAYIPIYPDYPDLPEQTDPPIPPREEETLPPQTDPPQTEPPVAPPDQSYLDPDGSYTTKDDVALYLHLYGRLPKNFITKNQAEDLYGWEGGSLSRYGMCIGGDRFYNREGQLPGGQTYYECDIDTLYSSRRGAKRLVFTYSGIIYYTSDHYKTFTRLY